MTGSVDETVKVWSGETLQLAQTFEGHQLGVVSVDVNALGTSK